MMAGDVRDLEGRIVASSGGIAVNEPPPTEGREVVLPQLIHDLQVRSDFGERKYGTKLMTHNGRDSLMDAYQELLDLAVYLCQAMMERSDRCGQRELQARNTVLVLENRELKAEVKRLREFASDMATIDKGVEAHG